MNGQGPTIADVLRIIGAAYDLLEAAEAALEIANTCDEFHDGAEGSDARRMLEEAIEKARGT